MAVQVFMVATGRELCEPPKTIPVVLTANTDVQEIDLTEPVRHGKIGFVQGVFIDNANGPAFVLECDTTRQRIRVSAGGQLVAQLLCINPPKFKVDFAGAGTTRFQFVNFPVVTQAF